MKISQTLDDILSHQRSPLDKSGLGYACEPSTNNDNASNNKDMRKPGRYDTPSSKKWKRQDDIRRKPTPRRLTDDVNNTKGNEYHQIIPRKKDFISTSRNSSSPRYQSIYLGYCYSCTNFGHMEKYYRAYHKDKYNYPRQYSKIDFARRSHDYSFMNDMEFFNWHTLDIWNVSETWLGSLKPWQPSQRIKLHKYGEGSKLGLKVSWTL